MSYTYTCSKCGKSRFKTMATKQRTYDDGVAVTVICARCCRKIREAAAMLARGG